MKFLEVLLIKNKNIQRGFTKLEVWNEDLYLYTFLCDINLEKINNISFKLRAQIEILIFSVSSKNIA